ncbi:MAG: ThiF family adenylyltransferase [Paracoccaceae bacterium]
MGLVLFLAAAFWGLGIAFRIPRQQRWALIAVLLAGVILSHLVLPDGHPLRQQTGGSAAPWLMLAGFGVLALVYRQGLVWLRRKADSREEPDMTQPKPTFSETELDRYARHIVLRELGGPGQKAMKEARVLVIGAGGLGAPALQYLAAAGVGTIGVIDHDEVDNANLQRQVIHTDARIGMPKVFSAETAMREQNPHIEVRPYHRRLTEEIAEELFAEYDIVLDGTDNFATRYLANAAAVKAGKPLVSGALAQWEGQISVFDPGHDAPCYRCVFPEAPAPGLAPSCAEAGVVGPLPGVIGAMMAVETIKLITGAGQALRGQMLIYDALYGETRKITLERRADCETCGG